MIVLCWATVLIDRKVRAVLPRPSPQLAWLARGEDTPTSDVDLLADFAAPKSLDAIDRITSYVADLTPAQFHENIIVQDAVIRQLQIGG